MSDDNVQVQEVVRGARGEIGTGTPSSKVKNLWKKLEFVNHPTRGKVSKSGVSLLAFAKKQSADGNADAKAWLKNRKGGGDQKKTAVRLAKAKELNASTKQSRHKKTGK